MRADDVDSVGSLTEDDEPLLGAEESAAPHVGGKSRTFILVLLLLTNLANYADRYVDTLAAARIALVQRRVDTGGGMAQRETRRQKST